MIEWAIDPFPPLNLFNYPSFYNMTYTHDIFAASAPYNNPYQGTDKRLLFVCSAGLLRSATAANLFAKKGFNTRSCGSASYALIPFSENLKLWADIIIFVNEENKQGVNRTGFDLSNKNVQVLDIPDSYEYNSPELIKLLEEQVVV